MFELLRKAFDLGTACGGLGPGGAGIALDAGEQRLDLGHACVCAFLCGGRGRPHLVELGPELLRTGPVLGGFRGGDVDQRLKIGGGNRRCIRVLLEMGFKFGGALPRLVGGRVCLVTFCLEPLGPVTVQLELARAAVDAGLEVGGAGRSRIRLERELLIEAVDLGAALRGLIFGGAGIALDAGEYRLDLGDPRIGALAHGSGCRPRLIQFGLELVGATAVLGGFGGGDVDERLEVSGGGGGGVGVPLELGLEFGGALAGLVCGGVCLITFGLQPVCPVTMPLEFGRRAGETGLQVGGGARCSVGLLRDPRFELGGAMSGLFGSRVRVVKVGLQSVSPVAVPRGVRGRDVRERLKVA